MTNKQTKLSVGMALDQVRESCSKVRNVQDELEFQRRERNRYIQDALEFIPVVQMQKVTGLSRDALYKIKHKPRDT